ncbi:MAG TPA: FAD-dependent oxidoreductase [Terriglobales bacterium]|nr:FAD-dependent oxidoreductase [Terriglobales bacterium]
MPTYTSSLLAREFVGDNILAVDLIKPPGFTFRAGQYADVALVSSPFHDVWGDLRTFSIASAPFEDHLEFVMRLSDTAFKRAMSLAPTGTTVDLKGPAGTLQLDPDETRPAVFLAGGVGIAPFLSMLRQAAHDRSPRPLYLFSSNHETKDFAYLGELGKSATTNALRLKLVPTVTGNAGSGWTGERGRIDASMLRRHIPAGTHPAYYISGPSQFVSAMISVLTALDIGEADTQIEDFGEF